MWFGKIDFIVTFKGLISRLAVTRAIRYRNLIKMKFMVLRSKFINLSSAGLEVKPSFLGGEFVL